jgi:hypothetical protein
MKTAYEMYQYCVDNKFGSGFNEKWGIKHFAIIENALTPDEDVRVCFIGLHNYISASKHDNNFAYAVTNKRILMAQKGVIGQSLKTVFLDNINDITFTSGILFGVIAIDTIKECFNVGLDKTQAANINSVIHELLYTLKNQADMSGVVTAQTADPVEEIKRYKELLDIGAITQEEFDAKKRKLL